MFAPPFFHAQKYLTPLFFHLHPSPVIDDRSLNSYIGSTFSGRKITDILMSGQKIAVNLLEKLA
jgi:hypothetical protein